jgi:hypothetical protein
MTATDPKLNLAAGNSFSIVDKISSSLFSFLIFT